MTYNGIHYICYDVSNRGQLPMNQSENGENVICETILYIYEYNVVPNNCMYHVCIVYNKVLQYNIYIQLHLKQSLQT